ncbi:MAG: hypothetical protein V4722_00930 [Bacteroidota bacterium]
MKQIIIASSVLLCAGAIYGFIDYSQQNDTGRLKELYKDEVYNAPATEKAKAIVSLQEKEETHTSLVKEETSGIVKVNATVNEEKATKKVNVVNDKRVLKVKKDIPPVIEEDYDKVFSKVELSPLKEEAKIVYLASATDSIEYRKKEEKQIRAAMFSRAPIRKKQAAVIIVSADSTSSFQ